MVSRAVGHVVDVGDDGAGGHGRNISQNPTTMATTETTVARPVHQPVGLDRDARQTAPLLLQTQLCLSVKTQPHVAVLRAAEEAGFHAECISMAEVHAAHAAGFDTTRIVLTVSCVCVGELGSARGAGGKPCCGQIQTCALSLSLDTDWHAWVYLDGAVHVDCTSEQNV